MAFTRKMSVTVVCVALAAFCAVFAGAQTTQSAPATVNADCEAVLHIILDCSGSMSGADRRTESKSIVDTVASFRSQRPNAKLSYVLYSFGTRAQFSINREGQAFTLRTTNSRQVGDSDVAAGWDPAQDPQPYKEDTFPKQVDIASAFSLDMTCHGCGFDLVEKNLGRLMTVPEWSKKQHVVIMVTDGQTTVTTDRSLKSYGDDIKTKYNAIVSIIFVGGQSTARPPPDLVGACSINAVTKAALYFHATDFTKLADEVAKLLGLSCDKRSELVVRPETKEVCDPLNIAVILDISKSVITPDTASYYRQFVGNVSTSFDAKHTKIGVFAFAGNAFQITDGFVPTDQAAAFYNKLQLGITNKYDLEGVSSAVSKQIQVGYEKFTARAHTPAGIEVGYARGLLGKLGATESQPVVEGIQPLESMTLHAKAVRLVTEKMTVLPGKKLIMIVTDGGAYDLTPACNKPFDKLDEGQKAKYKELKFTNPMEQATPEELWQTHSAFMCYENNKLWPTSDKFTPETIAARSALCPGLKAEYEASTCCEAKADCNLKDAVAAAKIPTTLHFIGNIYFSDTTAQRVSEANLLNDFGDGRTIFRARTLVDLAHTAKDALGEAPMVKQCRQVPVAK